MNEIIKGMANAAEAIQENFEEQGERLETVEQIVYFTNDVSYGSNITWSARTFQYLSGFKLVYIAFQAEFSSAQASGVLLFTIPEAYRPNYSRYIPLATIQGGYISIGANGQCYAYSSQTTQTFRASGFYSI